MTLLQALEYDPVKGKMPEPAYACNICHKEFRMLFSVTQHYRDKHPGLESSVFNRRREDHSRDDITLVVKGQGLLSDLPEEHLRLLDKTNSLGGLMKLYSGLIGVSELIFSFKGLTIHGSETPEDLGMKHNDIIDVVHITHYKP